MELDTIYNQWKSIQPLPESVRKQLETRFTVDYNYNSNHIEGNTLTYGQTELLLLFGKVSGEGHLKDFNDMKASEVTVRMIQEAASQKSVPLTQNFIRILHKTLLREDYTEYRTMPDGGGVRTGYVIHAGQYKTRPNSVITRYGDRFEYATPEETPSLMSDLVDWYNTEEQRGDLSPVELAALFHYQYIRIHPFEDGNGRIARLMVNFILSRHGWPMIVVRSRLKQEYLEALHKTDIIVGAIPSEGAHATINMIRPFLQYFERLVAKEIKSVVDFVTRKDEGLWWYDGEIIAARSKNVSRMLRLMKDNPEITYAELSTSLGINPSAVQKLVKNMIVRGYIARQEQGLWRVIATTIR